MEVTFYIRPNGSQKVVDIKNVEPADEAFFVQHNVKVSMENIGGEEYVAYADYGAVIDDEPDEAIELSKGRDCKATLHALRQQVEALLKEA